ncbi:hypothetical protein GCM10008995_16350 [Halobellus salinus]|uniref:Uncharacterized protein n=1 Tax=Halobellus salinus TaxID=931585 RepID=A0A830EN67_9EURY|nr:hypothetical protein [Halobellus salinus]GGJ07223.1 hypothetical protein GCM10008995_16350 [Halobellus salinus]SMP25801.1 hypothetical protein SAMN06265347_11122 [Halobellus salinus]
MFDRRDLNDDVATVRDEHAPDAVVLDVAADFETIPPAAAEDLGLFVDGLTPMSHPTEWLPEDAPSALVTYAGTDFTVGMPGDGTVVWTRQTTPPAVLVKKRADGTPTDFLRFLLAEAFVQVGTGAPEQFLPFFADAYRDLDAAVPLGPSDVYQIATALYDAWVGLQTREQFRAWEATNPRLFDAWNDAGSRLQGRLTTLPEAVARGSASFPEATEYACSAVKHGLELPAPFAALDTQAFVEYGPEYGVQWAEKTFEKLEENADPDGDDPGTSGSVSE